MLSSARWAFNISKWDPSEKEFLLATSCLQIEEKNRLDKFVYKKDVKASLAGRLMIRKFICEYTGLPYNSIKLLRDANSKPIYELPGSEFPIVSFNISHHGSFTVLAGEMGKKNIGVDIMKLEYNGGKSLEEFFRIMNRNFSSLEWKKINGTVPSSQQIKIANFCRNWALKESFVKAVGVGLTMDLHKINFHIHSDLQENTVTLDTSLYIDDVKQAWIFEESLLDQSHCVVVASEHQCFNLKSPTSNLHFTNLNSSKLLENAIPLLPHDFEYCKRYFSKDPV